MVKTNPWIAHLAKVRAANPKVKGPAVFILAKKSYNKK